MPKHRNTIWLLLSRKTNYFLREKCDAGEEYGMHTKQFPTKEDAEAFVIGMVMGGTADPEDWTPFEEPGKLRPPC